jgi:hypothetical protein
VTVIEGTITKDEESSDRNLSHQSSENLDQIPIFNKPPIPQAAEREIQSLQDLLGRCLSVLHKNLQDCAQSLSQSSSLSSLSTEGRVLGSFSCSDHEDRWSIAFHSEAVDLCAPSTGLCILLTLCLLHWPFDNNRQTNRFSLFPLPDVIGIIVLGELKWRRDLFHDYAQSIIEHLVVVLDCLMTSPYSLKERSVDINPTDDTDDWSAVSSKSHSKLRSAAPLSAPPSPQRLSSSHRNTQRPPSPTTSVTSVSSPGRSKRNSSSSEGANEKILQHAFYLTEALSKFDNSTPPPLPPPTLDIYRSDIIRSVVYSIKFLTLLVTEHSPRHNIGTLHSPSRS